MPNLKEWIEAQLKKGYSTSQIKAALSRRGYPSRAVAEVDRIRDSALPNKKIIEKSTSKPIAFVGIVIAIVFLVWLFNALPFSPKQQNLCDKFKDAQYTTTCEEAVSIATAKYGGVVQEIEQGTGFRKIGETAPGKDIWRIEIKLDKPVENNQKISDKVGVFLERKTGEELGASYR